jgi:hypothetical protein
MGIDSGNRNIRRNPTPMSHCPQISHDVIWDRPHAAALASRRLPHVSYGGFISNNVVFSVASESALDPTLSPIQLLPGYVCDHSLASDAEVKNMWRCISALLYTFLAWCLLKHKHEFTFYDSQNLHILVTLSVVSLDKKF